MAEPIVSFIGASGLDTSAIIDALANARRSPILRLQAQAAKLQRQSTEFGNLRTRLEALRTKASAIDTVSELRSHSASTSDPTVVTASATSSATEGVYAINVTSLAQAASKITAGFSEKTGLAIGSGEITINSGGTAYQIQIANGSDLEQIRDAINASAAPVTATIIDDGSGTDQYKLVLSSDKTGTSSDFSVDLSLFTPQAGPFGFSVLNAAQNASFTVNGAQIQRSSNTVTDVVPGVSLSLLKPGASATVTVSKDRDAVKSKIKDLVNAFNDLHDLFRAHGNPDTKDTTGVLYGDSTLRQAQTKLRNVVDTRLTGTGSSYDSLASIGITTGRDGRLSVDEAKLTEALNADYDGVIALFTTASTGIAVKAREAATTLGDSSVRIRTNGIQERIRSINSQVTNLEERLDQYIEQLRRKFSELDSISARLQAQGSALSALGG
jgi:flagellar hook-associated protein 2